MNRTAPHGLRYTVHLHGTVVDQGMLWRERMGRAGKWTPVPAAVPTGEAPHLARFRWIGPDQVEVEPVAEGTTHGTIGVGQEWEWDNGDGVRVTLDIIEERKAARLSEEAWGDVALFVMMLVLTVGVAQLNFVLRQILDGRVVAEQSMEPSPELIARLLMRDFEGAERGAADVGQARRPFGINPSFSLPAGSSGPVVDPGGGAEAGDVFRGGSEAEAEPSPSQASAPELTGGEEPAPVAEATAQRPALPPRVERFIGWGFEDWFTVPPGGEAVEEFMAGRLSLARVRMAIDPDDPFAILTTAYYAYLSENYGLCRDLYARYVRLYPDDSAGYNNLALTFKRTGDFVQEERLYRLALSVDPGDTNAMNNLAVNLAHQARFDEALSIMSDLETELPGDAYADLHRAKIYASMGKDRRSFRYLKRALSQAWTLDTFHHIEFRQDLRLEPAFTRMRQTSRFRRVVARTDVSRPARGVRGG